ncbi:MAG: Tad domain-containing protein [Stellaceae bacterium]
MTTKFRSVFWAFPRRLASDTRGATLALVAASITALIGFTGLGVETGLWYAIKRQDQSAADVAALSGAFELLAGQSNGLSQNTVYPDICNLAERDAARNNFAFTSFSCPTTTPACTSPPTGQMCANNPPVLGISAGNNNAVEVILSQQQNALLANLFLPKVTIETRAVAAIKTLDTSCVLALNNSLPDAINVVGSAGVCLGPGSSCQACGTPTCSMTADSTDPSAIHLQGAACVAADTLITPGGVGFTGNGHTLTVNSGPLIGAPPVADPYASTLTHTFLTTGMPTAPACTLTGSTYNGNCVITGGLNVNKTTINLSANTQISGASNGGVALDIKNGTVNLAPGTYWLTDGDLDLENGSGATLECTACTPGGAGVTIILTTANAKNGKVGTLTLGSNANLNLSAPGSGTFAGLVLIQDSNNLPPGTTYTSTTSNAQANATESLNGLVYFPNTAMTFQGTPAAGSATCLVLVVNTLALQGNPQLNDSGCTNAGLTNLPTPKTVALTE